MGTELACDLESTDSPNQGFSTLSALWNHLENIKRSRCPGHINQNLWGGTQALVISESFPGIASLQPQLKSYSLRPVLLKL